MKNSHLPQLDRPLNLRVDSLTRSRIETLARKHGVKTSDIVRFSIAAKISEWERNGVHLASNR